MKKQADIPAWTALKMVYEHVDKRVDGLLQSEKVTCRGEGCAGCCYQFVSATTIEALLIAHHIINQPGWKDMLPAIRAAALINDFEGITPGTYFRKAIPCVFLKDSRCTIYKVRPEQCRYYFVVSDPADCMPPTAKGTLALDMREAHNKIWALAMELLKAEPGHPIVGPLPVMVVYALKVILQDSTKACAVVEKAFRDTPDIFDWMGKHLDNFIRNAAREQAKYEKGD
jgi:Fe-S-cluster containining protein